MGSDSRRIRHQEGSGYARHRPMAIARPTIRSRRCPRLQDSPGASLGLLLAGLVFGLNSVTQSHDTIWGYALMVVTCLGLGFTFAILIWNRETGWINGGSRLPLE